MRILRLSLFTLALSPLFLIIKIKPEMGRIQRRKNNVAKNKKFHKALRTKRRTRDLDQIHEDMQHPEEVKEAVVDPDLQGGGHFYCVSCARHFTTRVAISTHIKSKGHKSRLK